MLTLHVVPVEGEPFDHPVAGEPIVIGRASSADLVLADRYLSRHHSRVFREDERLMVEDLGSRNGTFLNGRPLRGPESLRPGDTLKISGSVITVRDAREPPPERRPPSWPRLGESAILRDASSILYRASDTGRLSGEDELRRYAERLQVLNEVHRALGPSLELDELLEMILERVFRHLRPEQGAVFLRRADGLECAATRSSREVDAEIFTSRSLAEEVIEKGMAALVHDAANDERFSEAQSILVSGIRSLIAAPLLGPDAPLGMIVLSSRAGVRQFDEGDLELLVSLASVAALGLRNVELAAEAAERRRLERELALGRRIQEALLPDRLPRIPGYELYGRNVPSSGVSGDYYQVMERGGGHECVLMVADVSGKGIAASLLTASLEALAAGPIEDGHPPEEVCERLSRLLHRRTPPEKYATAVVVALEPASGRVRYANAGHVPALVVRANGEVEELGPTGPPIGLLEGARYASGTTELPPGDLLVLYTDGLTEAEDATRRLYGSESLLEVLVTSRGEPLERIVEEIDRDLARFADGAPQSDDRTLVMARRSSPG